jgi:flagellar L-ring protein FlgH
MRSALLLGLLAAAAVSHADPGVSLFEEGRYRSLVGEPKAARAGDVLTVVVQESSSASTSADLGTQRSLSLGLRAFVPLRGRDLAGNASAGLQSDHDGSGRTQRSGRLLAQLSVSVTEVLPNGDLAVAGAQTLRINDEEQTITLAGIVRRRDIGDNNTVLSSRIAQARIEFSGEGFVTEQSKPSWIARLFNFFGF